MTLLNRIPCWIVLAVPVVLGACSSGDRTSTPPGTRAEQRIDSEQDGGTFVPDAADVPTSDDGGTFVPDAASVPTFDDGGRCPDQRTCQALYYACPPGEEHVAEDCRCGCAPPIPPPSGCVIPNGPHVRWETSACPVMLLNCGPNDTRVSNECGCGCIGPTPECPSPNREQRRYVSRDPQECNVMLFECGPGETLFSDSCGCGCKPEGCVF